MPRDKGKLLLLFILSISLSFSLLITGKVISLVKKVETVGDRFTHKGER